MELAASSASARASASAASSIRCVDAECASMSARSVTWTLMVSPVSTSGTGTSSPPLPTSAGRRAYGSSLAEGPGLARSRLNRTGRTSDRDLRYRRDRAINCLVDKGRCSPRWTKPLGGHTSPRRWLSQRSSQNRDGFVQLRIPPIGVLDPKGHRDSGLDPNALQSPTIKDHVGNSQKQETIVAHE